MGVKIRRHSLGGRHRILKTIDFHRVLDGLGDAVVASDEADHIQYANRAALELLGWTSDGLLGQPLTVMMPERMHEAHRAGFARYMRTRQPKIMGQAVRVPAVRRDGTGLEIELTLSAFPQADGGVLVVASMRDLRQRLELEAQLVSQRRLLAQHNLMGVLVQSAGPADALPRVLESICTSLGWKAAIYWALDEEGLRLRPFAHWAAPGAALAATLEAGLGQRPLLTEGLRGRAWAARAAAVDQGAAAIAVAGALHEHGVIELFEGEAARPGDEEMLSTLSMLGMQLAQYLDRVRVEARAQRRARWLSTTLRSIGDAVIATDTAGGVSFMNPVAEALTGWSAGEAAGKPMSEVFPITDEASGERLESPVDRVLREGEVFGPSEGAVLETRGGGRSVVEHSAAQIEAEEGTLEGVVLVFRDITERRRLQREAQRQREHIAFLDEATTVLTASLDHEETLKRLADLAVPRVADWCVIYLAAEKDEGRIRQLVVAHADPEKTEWARELNVRYPPDPQAPRGAMAVIRTGQAEFYPEIPDALLVQSAKDEEHLRLLRELGIRSAMTVPLTFRDRVYGAMSFVTSESGRRYTAEDLGVARELARRAGQAIDNARLYSEVQTAVRVRDDFLSIASHELRTPLTPLQLQLDAIIRAAREGGGDLSSLQLTTKLDTISRSVVRLERLVNSLLEISRITGQRLRLDREEVDLVGLVREIAERFAPQLNQTGTRLMLYAPVTLVGQWDRTRLEQIVTNLLSNALKFGPGRPLEIRMEADERTATLEVADHGIGISEEDQKRIFERFERAVATRHFGGFGLGLWMVRQIVEAMGGSIRVASRLGQGSTFTVQIPLDGPEVPEAEPGDPRGTQPH
jgi:PAS domain S-box-containing protein